MASVYFANKFPTARIIALEPDASNFAMLEKNVRPYPQIRPINTALWEKSISMRITHQEWGAAGRTCEPDESGTIHAITIAELCHRFEIDHIDLLKVDIEGAEKGILRRNSSEWIGKVDRIVIELHDRCIPGLLLSLLQGNAGLDSSPSWRIHSFLENGCGLTAIDKPG